MVSLFFDKNSRSEVMKKVYNENKIDFHAKFTKIFEVISITSAIMAGLTTAFMTSSTDPILQGLSLISLSLSVFSFTTSIILIVIINTTEVRNIPLFIEDWCGVFIFPTVTTILSCLLTLTSVIFYVKNEVVYYVSPFIVLGVMLELLFYCKIMMTFYKTTTV